MTQQLIPGDNFEERLLTRLKTEVIERGATEEASAGGAAVTQKRSRHAPRLVLGAVAAVASLAAALVIGASGNNPPAAFAIEGQPEGGVRVEIRSLEDAKGLEEALDEAGVPAAVNYLATGTVCKEPRFQRAPWPEGSRAIVSGPGSGSGAFTFSVSSDAVASGQTLVITASPGLGDVQSAKVELAEGAVAPCEPVPVDGSSGSGE